MLREASSKLALVEAHAKYSLELAALPPAVVEPSQAQVVAETAVAALRGGVEGVARVFAFHDNRCSVSHPISKSI